MRRSCGSCALSALCALSPQCDPRSIVSELMLGKRGPGGRKADEFAPFVYGLETERAIVGLRPSFSAHVRPTASRGRRGEHGAPVRFPAACVSPLTTIGLLTPLVFLVHGYHPLADDGAVYVTGIKKLVNPSLYQTDAVFALSPTRLSIFAHVLAALLRWGHISLPVLLLACHAASIFLFLLGSWRVAARIFPNQPARWGAVLLAACCFTLPVAGTSLSIMDPYVTARSFSTPLMLFALAAVLDQQWIACALWLALGALLHPLMVCYTAIALLTVVLTRRRMWRSLGFLAAFAWLLCTFIFTATRHADPSLAYNQAALSRSYFFLSSWQWFEYPGLVMPLLLLGIGGSQRRAPWPARALAIAATVLGGCALLVSLCFVHRSGSLLLARLQ